MGYEYDPIPGRTAGQVDAAIAAASLLAHYSPVSGNWYDTTYSHGPLITESVAALIATTVYCVPIMFPVPVTITGMSVRVTTAVALSSIQLGVGQGSQQVLSPVTRLLDAGAVDTSTVGRKAITGLSLALQANVVYDLFALSGHGPTIYGWQVTSSGRTGLPEAYAAANYSPLLATIDNGVAFGALPATITRDDLMQFVPRIQVKVA